MKNLILVSIFAMMVFTNNCSNTSLNGGFVPANTVTSLDSEQAPSVDNGSDSMDSDTLSQPPTPVPLPVPTSTLPPLPSPPKNERLFYVSQTGNDSNPGTQGAPWKTFAKAAKTLVAGDTAVIMDGVYTEPQILFMTSGEESRPITIRAQNRHKAILSSTSGCGPNISIYASHVVIEGIRSSISPLNVACAAHNSADGTGVRCWHQNAATPASPSTGYRGCIVRDVLFDASTARSHAVKTSQDNALVENCTAYSGLETLNSYGNVFRNNLVIGGDAWGSSLVAKGGARNFEAYNNVVYVKSVWGKGVILGGSTGTQWLYDPPSGVEAYNSVAYNNVIINESGGYAEALGMRGAKDSFIFNNVVIGGFLTIAPGYAGVPSINPTIKNNIVMCLDGNLYSQLTYTGTLSLDYNNFFKCNNSSAQKHPINGDPLFVDFKSDWRLKANSPAINSGTLVNPIGFKGETFKVDTDKNGKNRTSPWDMGVYEAE